MKLPKELFDDIEIYKIGHRQEKRFEKLFDRFIELKEEELKNAELVDLEKEREKICNENGWTEGEMESKQDYINNILESYDGSEDEFIDYIVNVYIND